MPANYNSTQPGAVYRRINRITIEYPTPLTASVRANETEAVVEIGGGVAHKRDTRSLAVDVAPADFSRVMQLVDPTTGADLPGATMTVQALMLGMLAFLRAEQRRLDSAEAQQP